MLLIVEQLTTSLRDYATATVANLAAAILADAPGRVSCDRAGHALLEALQRQIDAPTGDLAFRSARVGIGPGSVALEWEDLKRHAAFKDWAFPNASAIIGHSLWLGATYANFAQGPALTAVHLIGDGKAHVRLVAVLTYPTDAGAMTAHLGFGGLEDGQSFTNSTQINGDLLALIGACSVDASDATLAPEAFATVTRH